MASLDHPEIILYDLASTKNECFSPIVWRIRLMLHYKNIPYRTVFLEFPDIAPTLQSFGIPEPPSGTVYTVPAIHHVPSGRYIMDSPVIAEFLEETYPSHPVQLKSEVGDKIVADARTAAWTVFRNSLMPREIHILIPRSAEYFRSSREEVLGCKLEDLLEGEEEAWEGVEGKLREIGGRMKENKERGPFIEGERPSWADFCVVGNLLCARVIHGGTFERLVVLEGWREVFGGCEGWMGRRD